VTHVITTRSIPTDVPEDQSPEEPEQPEPEPEEQPQTINPSLLDRNPVARRKLLFEFRNVPTRSQQLNDASKPVKGTRNNDVLHKALGMGKKIWSLDKFQTMVSVLLETEAQQATFSKGTGSRAHAGAMKGAHESNLLQLLHHERINGPSDRDPTASLRELNYFKGPYIYVWDMDEKQKPIMVREYAKVANKADGEWPQFRSVGNGRCPFVEEVEIPEKEYRKARAPAPATAKREDPVPILKPPEVPVPKPLTGKRSLAEMEDGQSRVRSATPTEFLNPAKAALSKLKDTRPQNAFTSRAEGGRLFHGEPVASGLQATNVTSAIRSQMISSTAGVTGVRAGTSKEIHGLQRKVLQKAGPTSQEASSRRFAEMTMDPTSSRSINVPRQNSKAPGQEDDGSKADGREKRSQSQSLKSKKDLKPGYCENCQDKFRDFDEVSCPQDEM
jgi:regulatory subunit for Cdc7p protein kinase